jgi:ribosomal protein L40E
LSTASARKVCPNCASLVSADAEKCPKCGASLVRIKEPTAPRQERSTRTATLASVIWPGLGQLYNGETRKGIGFIIAGVLVVLLALNEHPSRRTGEPPLFYLFIAVFFAVWLYGIYDASNTAKKTNEAAY